MLHPPCSRARRAPAVPARRRTGRRSVLLALLLLAGMLPILSSVRAAPVPGDPAPPAYDFGPSGLTGAGFQNVVVFSPFLDDQGRRTVLLGADIAGIHRSVDGGRTWTASNAGLGDRHVASLLFSATVRGKVYAATDSALYVSGDFGRHWTARPGAVGFDANGGFRLGGREHPRSTGALLAQDDASSGQHLYAATARQGVKRSSDDGATWDRVALAGHHLRSIALDPADADRLFAASAEGGLYLSTDARSGMTFTRVPGSPPVVEELEIVGGVLYVAAGSSGIHRYDGRWQPLNAGLPAGSHWQALTGHVDGDGRTVLLIGCSQPAGGVHTMRSSDGGESWRSISTGSDVTWHDEQYGQGDTWWASGSSYLDPEGRSFVASDLAVDPDDPTRLVLAGRGGAYVAEQGATGTSWWPAVDGLMATVGLTAVSDPGRPGRVHVATMDWTYVSSTDHGETFTRSAVPVGASSTGDVIALDLGGPTGLPSPVYLASSRRGQEAGAARIHSNPDPVAHPDGWTDERLPVQTGVRALAVGHAAGGNRVILASVAGKGLYRKEASTWGRLSGTLPFSSGGHGAFAWVPRSPVVYALDARGLWRSGDAGAAGSWRLLTPASAGYDSISKLAVDPVDPDVVYVSASALGGVARIRSADTGGPVITPLLALADAGPIAVTPSGELLAVDRGNARLLRSAVPRAEAPTFSDVGGSFFAANNGPVRSLAVDAFGHVYTASPSGGVTVASPLDMPHDTGPPSTPSGLASPEQTPRSVTLTWNPAADDTRVVGYEILRNATAIGVVAASDPPAFVDTGVSPDNAYAYAVRARDAAGVWGEVSEVHGVRTPPSVNAPPAGPSSLRARLAATGGKQVALDWPAAADDVGVTGYRVSRDGALVATVPGTAWTDTAPAPGPHAYAVTAVDGEGAVSAGAEAAVVVPGPAPAGLTGTYFDTASFTTQRLVRVDPTVNFSWGTGRPAGAVAADTFSVRWTGRVVVPAGGGWTFTTASDEGVRLWVAGQLVVDNWTPHTLVERRGTVELSADRAHDVRIEFQERTGAATMRLLWAGPGTSRQVVPSARLLAG